MGSDWIIACIERGEAGAFQEPVDGGLRRADARPLALVLDVAPLGRQADHVQGEAPRRGIGAGAFIDEAALHQRVGDELLQILRRLALHAGGDFFAEQFEQEIGHGDAGLWSFPLAPRAMGKAGMESTERWKPSHWSPPAPSAW